MKVRDIVLISMPQADGKTKKRPGLILYKIPPFDDVLICGISSQLKNKVDNLDMIIGQNHPDWNNSGLRVPSLIRVGYIATLPIRLIDGAIGEISGNTYDTLTKNLINFLNEQNLDFEKGK